jgi:hypothetical protein
LCGGGFAREDRGLVAAQVHGARPAQFGIGPRDRLRNQEIDLRRRRTVAVGLELPPVGRGQPPAREVEQTAGADRQQHGRHLGQFAEVRDRATGVQDPAVIEEIVGERARDAPAPAPRQRPARRVREVPEQQCGHPRREAGQPADGVRGDPGEQRGRYLAGKQVLHRRGALCQHPGGQPQQHRRVRGEPSLVREQPVHQRLAVPHQRPQQPAVASTVRTEVLTGPVQAPVGQPGTATVQRVPVGDFGPAQFDLAPLEIELAEKPAGRGHRVHRGADVVHHIGVEQRLRPQTAPEVRGAFADFHAQPGTSQDHPGRQPVRTGPDHDGISSGHGSTIGAGHRAGRVMNSA